MIVVSDMTPLHYLILIGCDHILHRLYERVFTAPAVINEMNDPSTPEAVRQWATAPPEWLHVQEPAHIEDIPRLGHGKRGAGEKKECKRVIEDMKQRELVRKQTHDQDRARQDQIVGGKAASTPEPS